jgi:hypothetical protein
MKTAIARWFHLLTCAMAGFTLVTLIISIHAGIVLSDAQSRLGILVDMRGLIEEGYTLSHGAAAPRDHAPHSY